MRLEIKEQKRLLRKSVLQQIQLLSEDYKSMADTRIVQKLLELPEYRQADTVFCFVGTNHEINTRPFLQRALDDGKRLCVPLCVGKGIMEARQIKSLNEMKCGYYGLYEPSPSAPIVPITEVGFAVIPCLTTDRCGNRLGHGGGFYDRLFNQYPDTKAAIICREQLIQESLPLESLDHRFALTVTEKEIHRQSKQNRRSNQMNLFEPTIIGGIASRNHIVRSATGEGKATADGAPTEQIKQVYMMLARNEVGVIITSLTSIAGYEQASRNQLSIDRDELIPAYQEITRAVHAEGGKIVMQLFHGSSTSQAFPETARILGPSALRNPYSGLIPQEMSKADMADVAELFANAAVRAKKAGFDGVQLHGAHSCLLSQFLSPVFNQRTDSFGGSRENRFRLIRQVYEAVRNAVGSDYPIWIKIDSNDGFASGLSTEDFLWNGEQLAALGMNAIEVSGMSQPRFSTGPYYREAAAQLSDRINSSVILTGGVRTLEEMHEIAAESRIQAFGMSRPFLAYPDYILRLKGGNHYEQTIRFESICI